MTDPRSTYRWRMLRPVILKRDDYTCAMSSQACDGPLHVDHIAPVSKTEEDMWFNPDNLQTLCRFHNYQKHDKTGQTTDYIDAVWLAWEAR